MSPKDSPSTLCESLGQETADKQKPLTPLSRASLGEHFCHTDFAKLIVGREKQAMYVHKSVLCGESGFFKACLYSGFAETQMSTVELPEDDPIVVRQFIQWLYTGTFEITGAMSPSVHAYSFADKIGAYNFCNDIVDAEHADLRARGLYVCLNAVSEIYEYGLKDSGLAHLCLKSYVWDLISRDTPNTKGRLDQLEEVKLAAADSLMEDILKEIIMYREKPWEDPATLSGCHFHIHEIDSTCAEASPGSTPSTQA